MSELKNRLLKRYKHLKRWAKREGLFCYRIYERDLPNYPLIIDYLDGDLVAWLYERSRDDTEDKKQQFIELCKREIIEAFGVTEENLHLKYRGKQKGLESQYTKLSRRSQSKTVMEQGLKFELNLSDYLDTGLFLAS